VERDFSIARAKVDAEGVCRVCGTSRDLQAAHIAYRRYDPKVAKKRAVVVPDDICPLCRSCHEKYDQHRLDLLPYLSLREQGRAAYLLGIARAYERTTGTRL
jgi:hypothetical protein